MAVALAALDAQVEMLAADRDSRSVPVNRRRDADEAAAQAAAATGTGGVTRGTVRGDHCQCPTCYEYFNSTAVFDKHRMATTGAPALPDSREMRVKGMAVSASRWWVTSPREDAVSSSYSDSKSDSDAEDATPVA
jgi:hypothetical protein